MAARSKGTGEWTKRERERDLERLLTFIDAIVAIAITLLVLPLVDIATGISEDDSVRALIADHWTELGSFFLSFAVIARLWLAQQRAVRPVVRSHPLATLLLIAWSLTIAFLPFPTALVAEAGSQSATKILYVGTLVVSTTMLGLLGVIVNRHPEIADGHRTDPAAAVMNVSLLLAALLLMVTIPDASYYPMLLLLLDDRLRNALHRVRGSRR